MMKLIGGYALVGCGLFFALLAGNQLAHQHGPIMASLALAVISCAGGILLATDK